MGYMLELVMVDVGNGGHDEALTVVGLMVLRNGRVWGKCCGPGRGLRGRHYVGVDIGVANMGD